MVEFSPDLELHEKCGVFGAFNVEDVAVSAMKALVALNHRGQEGAGLATYDGTDFHFVGNGGLVREILTNEALAELAGNHAIGQTRYGTSGKSGSYHIQPIRRRNLFFAENGNQCDTSPMERFLGDRGLSYEGMNDSEMKPTVLDYLITVEGLSTEKAIERAYPLFTGAFASVVLDETSLSAYRDKHGIRPLTLGRKGAGWLVASETCAIIAAGGEVVRDVEPGELITITKDGVRSNRLAEADPKLDIFEIIYFAREDSEMLGRSIYSLRHDLGKQLAAEQPVEADIVIPIPNSAIPAALGFAEASGIPYTPALLKSSYIHRTFIGPDQKARDETRAMKFSVIPELVRGKRVVLIDDSIVRGTTQEGMVKMLLDAGASEVHVRITSAPIEWPDFYGINTPKRSELAIVRYNGVEGVRKQIRAKSLGYLSIDGMVKATGHPKERFCLSAFNGEYPLDIGERAKVLLDA